MPPCCQPGLCSELCLCTGPCVIYFPREDQLRWRIRASAELSFSFFFFFLFKRNQANPHIERKIVPFGCCLVRLVPLNVTASLQRAWTPVSADPLGPRHRPDSFCGRPGWGWAGQDYRRLKPRTPGAGLALPRSAPLQGGSCWEFRALVYSARARKRCPHAAGTPSCSTPLRPPPEPPTSTSPDPRVNKSALRLSVLPALFRPRCLGD